VLGEFTGPLLELLGPVRAAHAEASPESDTTGYFLVFSTDSDPKLLRVFTTKTSYTPDKKAWDTLLSVNIWTTLSILTATFNQGSLTLKDGPYTGGSVQFCILR
jgi:hypothetical protein